MRVNLHAAKVSLSAYVKRVQQGETVIICNRNVPVAELRPVENLESTQPRRERLLGFARGEFTIPESFFDTLPDELLREAKEATGGRSDTDTVRMGLEALVRHAAYQRSRAFLGSEPEAQDVPRRREPPVTDRREG